MQPPARPDQGEFLPPPRLDQGRARDTKGESAAWAPHGGWVEGGQPPAEPDLGESPPNLSPDHVGSAWATPRGTQPTHIQESNKQVRTYLELSSDEPIKKETVAHTPRVHPKCGPVTPTTGQGQGEWPACEWTNEGDTPPASPDQGESDSTPHEGFSPPTRPAPPTRQGQG